MQTETIIYFIKCFFYHILIQDRQLSFILNPTEGNSPESLVGKFFHLLSKQMLGGISEDMMEVTPRSTSRMAPKLIPTNMTEPVKYKIISNPHSQNNALLWCNIKEATNLHCVQTGRLQILKGRVFFLQHFQNLPFMKQ